MIMAKDLDEVKLQHITKNLLSMPTKPREKTKFASQKKPKKKPAKRKPNTR
jgi:hypothetical protein